MAQLAYLRDELGYLKDCVHHQRVAIDHQRREIDFLKEDLYCQNNYTRDVENRIYHLERQSRNDRNNFQVGSEERTAIWRQLNEVKVKIDRFFHVHNDIRKAVSAFGKRCSNIVRATLRLNNKFISHTEDMEVTLLLD